MLRQWRENCRATDCRVPSLGVTSRSWISGASVPSSPETLTWAPLPAGLVGRQPSEPPASGPPIVFFVSPDRGRKCGDVWAQP
jgi:hypothetical protein